MNTRVCGGDSPIAGAVIAEAEDAVAVQNE